MAYLGLLRHGKKLPPYFIPLDSVLEKGVMLPNGVFFNLKIYDFVS